MEEYLAPFREIQTEYFKTQFITKSRVVPDMRDQATLLYYFF